VIIINSTNINKTNLAELNEHKKIITYDVGNLDPGLGQALNDSPSDD